MFRLTSLKHSIYNEDYSIEKHNEYYEYKSTAQIPPEA